MYFELYKRYNLAYNAKETHIIKEAQTNFAS